MHSSPLFSGHFCQFVCHYRGNLSAYNLLYREHNFALPKTTRGVLARKYSFHTEIKMDTSKLTPENREALMDQVRTEMAIANTTSLLKVSRNGRLHHVTVPGASYGTTVILIL